MADAPQGLFWFSGIQSLLHARFTLTLGTSPSVATLYIPPQPGPLPNIGTLSIAYGGGRIDFPDCRLIDRHDEISNDGFQVWSISVADHRWRWKWPVINGEYNIRMDDQTVRGSGGQRNVQSNTIRQMQELVGLCFEALGERGAKFDVVQNGTFPESRWESKLATAALDELLESVNCTVRLLPGNKISVVRFNEGNNLPGGAILSNSQATVPPDVPDSIRIAFGRTLWQHDFELEAVGREPDGRVRPINQLSYTPTTAGGWSAIDLPHFQGIKDRRCRELAAETVYRWYRIKTPFTLPGWGEEITDLDRILPITDRQIQKANFNGREETLPAWVYGQYYEGHSKLANNITKLVGDLKIDPRSIYTREYSIDQERGIVKLADATYMNTPYQNIGALRRPANLRLRTSVNLRQDKTRAWLYYGYTRRISQQSLGTDPLEIRHDDLALQFHRVNGQKIESNRKDCDEAADYYINAAQSAMITTHPVTRKYAGFLAIPPDGNILQVAWWIEPDGHAYTQASWQNEADRKHVPTINEQRFNQSLNDALEAVRKIPRERRKRGQ